MKAKKSLGQNFLSNTNILSKIVDKSEILNSDIILEIGPGTGNLTKELMKKNPKKIIVVEKDNNLSKILINKYGNKIHVINNDILQCYKNFKDNKPIKVFGNLPYNISTQILTSFIKLDNMEKIFSNFTFIFQKEVADRILAEENTKNYGRLTILTSWKMNCERILDIDPKYFFPKPKVWSTLVVLTPKLKIEKIDNPKNLEHITNIFFNQRRKMIKKPMKQLFANYGVVAKKLDIDLNLRPQNLSKNKYLEICQIYENLNK